MTAVLKCNSRPFSAGSPLDKEYTMIFSTKNRLIALKCLGETTVSCYAALL